MDNMPWSIASNGRIEGNDVKVYAVPTLEAVADGVTAEEKLKSDVLSNKDGEAIVLSGASEVEGNAKAVGAISLLGEAVVKGDVLGGQPLTQLEIRKTAADYDPELEGTPSLVYGPSVESVEGRYDYTGDLTIADLKMADGLLFVRGNVTVTGNISGIGAIVATGDITVRGSMNTSADLAALVAGGDIKIQGVGEASSSFQGLVLAEGSFSAKDTTVVGTVVSKDTEGKVELERVSMVRPKDLSKIDLDYDVELKKALEGYNVGEYADSEEKVGVLYNNEFIEYRPENYGALKALAERIKADGGAGQVVVRNASGEYQATAPSGGSLRTRFLRVNNSWQTYENQVKTDTVITEQIFQLDFNEFLRAKGSFRPLYQRVTPYEDLEKET